jgi:hypothetical protein
MADRLMVQGIVPKLMTVAEYTAFIGAETRKFRKVVADANIKLSN